MEDRLKKIEARLFNMEMLLLDLKILKKSAGSDRIIDIKRASEISGLNTNHLYSAARKNKIPIYFFERELTACLQHANEISIPEDSISSNG